MRRPPASFSRTFLTGADVVLPDRLASGLTLVVEGDRIADIVSGSLAATSEGERRVDLSGHLVAPGFVDVHVHGVAGIDALDGDGAVAAIASSLPQWGVTAFCPTTVACAPAALDACLAEVSRLRARPSPGQARVLPAHIESNFINPTHRGAQPLAALRTPDARVDRADDGVSYSGRDVLAVIDRWRTDVAIVTLAPEIDGGLDLLRAFVAAGVRVSLGHSGATFEEAEAAIAAGAHQVTHLFNAMRPMGHRDPGLAGAALAAANLTAELICDGHHVHAAVMRMAIAVKGTSRVMAITDGTAGSGLPRGSRRQLGGQAITVHDVARLDDGTMAGSALTMDRAFAYLINNLQLDVVRATEMCSLTPARTLGLSDRGRIVAGAAADLVALNSRLEVVGTWLGGEPAWEPGAPADRLDRT